LGGWERSYSDEVLIQGGILLGFEPVELEVERLELGVLEDTPEVRGVRER
jgi:hypothetical protein